MMQVENVIGVVPDLGFQHPNISFMLAALGHDIRPVTIMVDQHVKLAHTPAVAGNGVLDVFVHAAFVSISRVISEQTTDAVAGDVRRDAVGNDVSKENVVAFGPRVGDLPAEQVSGRGVQFLIGIQDQDPFVGCVFEGLIAGIGIAVVPGELIDLRAVRLGDFGRAVARTGVDDYDLVGEVLRAVEALGNERLFIAGDHAQRNVRPSLGRGR